MNNDILDVKKSKFLSAVKRASAALGAPPPEVNFNDHCDGFGTQRTAHIHIDEYVICVSEIYLKKLSYEEIEEMATHEVSHLVELSHDERFRNIHRKIKRASWKPPTPGVVIVNGNKRRGASSVPQQKPERSTTTCNYHFCDEETDLQQCPHCSGYFCKEHIKPKLPMMAPFDSASSRDWEIWRDKKGHPCPEFVEEHNRQQKEEKAKYRNALERLLSTPAKRKTPSSSTEKGWTATSGKTWTQTSYRSPSWISSFLWVLGFFLPFIVGLTTISVLLHWMIPYSSSDIVTFFGDDFTLALLVMAFLFPAHSIMSWIAWIVSGAAAGALTKRILIPFAATYGISWILLYLLLQDKVVNQFGQMLDMLKGFIAVHAIVAFLAFAFGGWLTSNLRRQ